MSDNKPEVYEWRQSYDRFGDDLCEVLLSYMSLEDRFRYECLSKQWQSLVYKTQTDLIVDDKHFRHFGDNSYDSQRFQRFIQSVVKKCPNVSYIEIRNYIPGHYW